MAIKYYYSDHGTLKGPFLKHELVGKPITHDTLVWIEGMTNWQPASEVPMFADILDGTFRPGSEAISQPQSFERPAQRMQNTNIAPPQNTVYSPQQNTPFIGGGNSGPIPGYSNQQQPTYPASYQAQQAYGPQQYGVPRHSTGGEKMPSNQMGWTLTGTVLSGLATLSALAGFFPALVFCIPLILGIIGLSKGSTVSSFWAARRPEDAYRASKQAKTLGIWSIVVFVVLNFIGLVMLIAGIGFIAAMADSSYY